MKYMGLPWEQKNEGYYRRLRYEKNEAVCGRITFEPHLNRWECQAFNTNRSFIFDYGECFAATLEEAMCIVDTALENAGWKLLEEKHLSLL